MAPGQKRKRPERTYSHDSNDGSSNRPSPHRPQNLNLAQQNQQYHSPNNRGNRRGGNRGGRGGHSHQHSPASGPNAHSPANTTSQPSTPSVPRTASTPSVNAPPPPPAFQPPAQSQPAPKLVSQPPPAPKVPPKPYFYEYVTDKRVGQWSQRGSAEVINTAVEAQKDVIILTTIFQELVRAGLDGRLDPEVAGRSVKEILEKIEPDAEPDSAELFLDTISIMLDEFDIKNPYLRNILFSTNISAEKMRLILEHDVLTNVGLVRNTFYRKSIRNTTDTYYRQSAYNLLREETEGYAKLITEYFDMANREAPTDVMVSASFQRIKALIGAFDLDVGRVLDVTLDVVANQLVSNGTFFIKFLRASSWWPEEKPFKGIDTTTLQIPSLPSWALPDCPRWVHTEEERQQMLATRDQRDVQFWKRVKEIGVKAYFELGGRRVLNNLTTLENAEAKALSEKDLEWVTKTGMLPPSGNTTAAQLLGYKLQFYASDRRGENDNLPSNLIYLTALLIKIGFISLQDIYAYLYPSDEDMSALKEKLIAQKVEREKKRMPGGGALNALASAGALSDDTLPPPAMSRLREDPRAPSLKPETGSDKPGTPANAEEEEAKPKLPEPADQKRLLLESLLCFGCLPEALHLLGRFPWLIDGYPSLMKFLNRIFHHSISKLSESTKTKAVSFGTELGRELRAETGASKGHLKTEALDPTRSKRWMDIEAREPSSVSRAGGELMDFQFYWKDWCDNIPTCQTVDDFFLFCNTLLNIAGFKFASDASLLTKIARIGMKSLKDDKSKENFDRWFELSKRLIVPAVSLTDKNSGCVNEIWKLIRLFPVKTRYQIYAEWFMGQTSRHPDIKTAFDLATAETKDTLKRTSRTNATRQAKVFAKTADANPGILFRVALGQIESYENLIDVFVDCVKYMSFMAYDVLTWSLLNSLSGRGRDRTQADGMLTSPWLRALSTFAGKTFKSYEQVDAVPVLYYIIHQLQSGNSTDLGLLEQILTQMTGISSDVSLNEQQTQAMAGGKWLRRQTLINLADERHLENTIKTSQRLMKSLTREQNIAGQLLILIARERQDYAFRDAVADAPLKVVGNNLDTIHRIFMQYLEALRHNLSIEEFNTAVPDVVSLISDFGINKEIAFAIARPSIKAAMDEADATLKADEKKKRDDRRNSTAEQPATNDDVEMGEADGVKEPETPAANGTAPDAMDTDAPAGSPPAATSTPPRTAAQYEVNPVLKELTAKLKPIMPEGFEDTMSLSFYTRFWQLSLEDLLVPTDSYQVEIGRVRDTVMKIRGERGDVSNRGKMDRDRRRKEYQDLHDNLHAEMKSQVAGYTNFRNNFLNKENQHWFTAFPVSKGEAVHDAIIQECFFPRILLSPMDALYVFKMIMFLHSSGTPGFRTMQLIDRMMRQDVLTSMFFMCSAREAENLGRFLNELLRELSRWHADEQTYVKAAHGPKKNFSGFAKKINPDRTPAAFLEYEDFRRLLYKWHSGLSAALKACLTGGEYMHIRNAIAIANTLHQCFPVVNWMGTALVNTIESLSKSERREDLKLSATSALSNLKKHEKEWVPVQNFRLGDGPPGSVGRNASRSGSARPSTPQPPTADGKKTLNPDAPEYKPKADTSSLSNGITNSRPYASSRDVEDGEIRDAKVGSAGANEQSAPGAPTGPSATAEQASTATITSDQKSEVTAQVEQVRPSSRQSDGKPPSIATTASPVPPREGPPKYEGGRGPPPSRTPHALPSRPDGPPRGARGSDRLNERPSDYHGHPRHDGRGPPNDFGRLDRPDRPGDNMRDSFNERGPRRSPGYGARGRSRSPGPERMPVRDRGEPDWSRDYPDDRGMRPPPRDSRGPPPPMYREGPPDGRMRPPMDSRGPPPMDSRSRLHSSPMGPPLRDPLLHPDRAPHLDIDRNGVNLERAARIIDTEPKGRDRLPNYREGDSRRDRGSRPHSPSRRGDDRLSQSFPPRIDLPPRDAYDDRGMLDRPSGSSFPPSSRDRRDEPGANAPTGPRGDRGSRSDFNERPPDRSRELFQPSSGHRPPQDPNHGRLNQDFSMPPSRQQDPNYGRLNQGSDIPSGPRGRNAGRGGRNFSVPQGPSGPMPPASPAADRPPSGDRRGDRDRERDRDRRDAPLVEGPPSTHGSGPPTPASASNEQAPAAGEANAAGVHPSRLSMFQPSPLQTDNLPAPPPSGPRSSQRGPHGPPSGPSPSTRGPPTGPASSADRRQEDKRFANIQNVLNQGSGSGGSGRDRAGPPTPGEQGASIRGRAGRMPGGPSSPASSSRPGTPTRPDLMASRNLDRGDVQTPGERDDGRPRRGGARDTNPGSERKRHRSRSRSPHREREGGGSGRRDEHRDRDRGGRDKEREGRDRDRERGDRRASGRGGDGPPSGSRVDELRMEGGGGGGGGGFGPQHQHVGGPLPPQQQMPPQDWNDGRNGDGGRGLRGGVGERRDDRDRRGKRPRGPVGDEGPGGQHGGGGHESKRPRRSG